MYDKCIENEQIMRKILLLIGFFIGLINIQAQIVNEGVLKIEPGTTVYFGDDYTNKSGAVHDNDGDLHLNGDFTNDGTVQSTSTTTGDGITYFDSPTNASATENATQTLKGSSNAAQFNNLVVNNTSTSVQGLAVTDEYNLEVTNGVTLTNGKIRLMGEAQLIQTHTGATSNSGNGHLLKDQKGAQNAYRYNYWSSPVADPTSGTYKVTEVLKDGTVTDQWSPTQVDFTISLEGTVASGGNPLELSTRWIYKYINGTQNPYNDAGWLSLFNIGTLAESGDAEVNPAQGYIMKGTDEDALLAATQNYSFEGKPNDGDYTLSISADSEYLVGNPYPSNMDAHEFINDNSGVLKDGQIMFWIHWSTDTHVYTEYGGGYATRNLTTGTPPTIHDDFTSGSGSSTFEPTQYIPVAQGFIVWSKGTAGSIEFNNSQRVFNSGTAFAKTNNTSDTGVVGLIRLGYENPNLMHRSLALGFTNGTATNEKDYGYDARMIDVTSDDMFFTIADLGIPFVIQGVGAYDIEASYPLTIKVATAGEHRIILDATESFDEPIYILDKDINTTYDIRNTDFTINLEAGEYTDRFEVVFQPHAPLEVDNYLNDFVTIYYSNNEIVIQNFENATLTNLQVYNSLGQLIYQNNNQGQLSATEIRIPFDFAQTAYILKLQAIKGKGTYKFINH